MSVRIYVSDGGKAVEKTAHQLAIESLVYLGFEDDGETRGDCLKIITRKSYPLPGAIANISSRVRLKLPGTAWKVTVGKITTNFYTVENHKVTSFKQFKTKMLPDIVAFAENLAANAGSEVTTNAQTV